MLDKLKDYIEELNNTIKYYEEQEKQNIDIETTYIIKGSIATYAEVIYELEKIIESK